jgi:CheY-like chemotaxis protein
VLEQAGAQVRAAASVAEALAVFAQWPPSVLISDIEMPEADGYELIRRVRAMERPEQPARQGGGRVPAVALTAYARAEDRTRALAAGFELHLAKPFDPAHLVALVSDLARRAGQATSSAK